MLTIIYPFTDYAYIYFNSTLDSIHGVSTQRIYPHSPLLQISPYLGQTLKEDMQAKHWKLLMLYYKHKHLDYKVIAVKFIVKD
jgi:hypothetical protein